MVQVIRSGERHFADHGWLQTYWHFSFDTYRDPKNVHWGALRVFNDDVIQPGKGFPMHGHRDMEIITCVLEGALEHQDSMGNRGVILPGEVQVMSAGSGVTHSEYNHSKEKPVHLLQLWVLPRTKSRPPRWEQKKFRSLERAGRLLPVVSSGDVPGTLAIDQDAAIYLSSLKSGEAVVHRSREKRKAYAFVISGGVTLNDTTLAAGDQARIAEETELRMRASGDAEVILLDLPA
ncbi:MAG: pirin family protein [Acidobacteria bacterium]|nr:pirin family protein [Acidobacteriota bacterium]MCL5288782.1 pirin family protein [Acidobacteriota bacterium]